ncbi:unnamed protein product [Hermetia illucens]|uniref:N-acylneuraminate cytidylyltransferase n=1 Tax=Hermetia illucens TaxID=343691 RepID=A0A7R8UJ36_HERIL|nr:unnamed protein product [Hermetia illucens]
MHVVQTKHAHGAKVHKRLENLAQDTTPSIEAVQDFIQGHPNVNSVALFQCTSVFLRTKYIHEACRTFQNADCVFASTRDFKLRWVFDSEGKYIKPVNFDPLDRPRRQDWHGELVETGMFYLTKRELLLDGTFQNDRCKVVVIDKDDALELDDFNDLKYARYLLE